MATTTTSSVIQNEVNFAPEAARPYDASVKVVEKGFALIISHEKFTQSGKRRHGNYKDLKKLSSLMKILNFNYRVIHDKKKDVLLREIKSLFCADLYKLPEFRKKKRPLPEHQCIMVIVMTHGNSGGILYDREMSMYFIQDVWQPFVTANLNDNKPLIFVFQACRGSGQDKGKGLSFGDNSSRLEAMASHVEPDGKGDSSKSNVLLPNAPNVLIAFSTVEDHVSWRHTSHGTFYVQQLCLAIEGGVTRGEDVATMLTKAQLMMADQNIHCDDPQRGIYRVKQMPSFTSFLSYKLYFQSCTGTSS